jgi:hypothetical protein
MKIAIPALLGSSLLLMSGAALAQYGGQAGGQYGTSGGYSYSGGSMPSSSSDDNIGLEQQIVFGVERTMGLFFIKDKIEQSAAGVTQTVSTDTTTIALFGNLGAVPVTIPRLALDYFVVDGFSVGASFIYWRTSGTSTLEAGGASSEADSPTLSTVVIHPRLGYSFIFDETLALWLRGGITWSSFNVTTQVEGTSATGGRVTQDEENNASAFDLSFDVPLVISPIENFAILIGPFVDIGLSGTVESVTVNDPGDPSAGTTTQEADHTLTAFGLSVGISAYY